MADRIIHKGDIGVVLEVTFKDKDGTVIDISSETTKQLYLRKPDLTTVTVVGAFTTDGTDGKLKFVTISDTLDTVGLWRYQGHVITAALDIVTEREEIVVRDRIV